MKTLSQLWQYLAVFFSEWEMFQLKVADKINTHSLCSSKADETRAYVPTIKMVRTSRKPNNKRDAERLQSCAFVAVNWRRRNNNKPPTNVHSSFKKKSMFKNIALTLTTFVVKKV